MRFFIRFKYLSQLPLFFLDFLPDKVQVASEICGCTIRSLEWNLDDLEKRMDRFPNMGIELSHMSNLQLHALTNWQKTIVFLLNIRTGIFMVQAMQ